MEDFFLILKKIANLLTIHLKLPQNIRLLIYIHLSFNAFSFIFLLKLLNPLTYNLRGITQINCKFDLKKNISTCLNSQMFTFYMLLLSLFIIFNLLKLNKILTKKEQDKINGFSVSINTSTCIIAKFLLCNTYVLTFLSCNILGINLEQLSLTDLAFSVPVNTSSSSILNNSSHSRYNQIC